MLGQLLRFRTAILGAAMLMAVYAAAAWLLLLPDIALPPSNALADAPAAECRAASRRERGDRTILFVPLDQVPEHLVGSLLQQEDRAFHSHRGVNWATFLRALRKNVAAGEYRYGAGTITMQLMRELELGKDRTLLRKAREVAYALQAENRLSKYEILELYLNVVHWGPGIRGVGAASCFYFGVPPAQLSPEDGRSLVAVLPNPPVFGPRLRRQLARRTAEETGAAVVPADDDRPTDFEPPR